MHGKVHSWQYRTMSDFRDNSTCLVKLAHSRIFFFSHPSTVFTQMSPVLRQSLEINGIVATRQRRGRLRRLAAFPWRGESRWQCRDFDETRANFARTTEPGRSNDQSNALALLRPQSRSRMALFDWRHGHQLYITHAFLLSSFLFLPSSAKRNLARSRSC